MQMKYFWLASLIATISLSGCGGEHAKTDENTNPSPTNSTSSSSSNSSSSSSSSSSSASSSSSGGAVSNSQINGVSASLDDGNIARHALDGDLSTRWSANGQGETLSLNFSEIAEITAVDIAFFKGDERVAFFDLYYKENNEWKLLMKDLASSGDTTQAQNFSFSPVYTNGLRYFGKGNSANSFNSITEIAVTDTNGNKLPIDLPAIVVPIDPKPTDPKPTDPGNSDRVFKLDFNDMMAGETYIKDSIVRADCSPSKQNNCLRAAYKKLVKNGKSSGTIRQQTSANIPKDDAYTLQFDVKFDQNFDFVKGGKMHGLGPKVSTTGCKDQIPNGWSVRIMWWYLRNKPEAILYVYDQDRNAENKNCGQQIGFESVKNTKAFPNGIAFKRGQYHAVSLYVKVNSAGNKRDGLIQLFIDGELYAQYKDVKLRQTINSDTLITKFMYNTFFGGGDASWTPSKTEYVNYDNFEVWKGKKVRQKPGK